MMGKYILQIQSFGIYDFFQINSKPILNSGNVPLEKDIKNAGSPPTARKMKEYTLLVYNLLSEISLPKPLPVCFLNSHG